MININLYTNNGEKTLEFKFQTPVFDKVPSMDWIKISATGRSFIIKGVPFIAYDEEIKSTPILIDLMNIGRLEINEVYNNQGKLLIIFSPDGTPIKMFYGDKIMFLEEKSGLNCFEIDEKPLTTFQMNYLILTKNKI